MEIELSAPLGDECQAPRVSVAAVSLAHRDAHQAVPSFVHRTVALAVTHSSEKTARLRLERLARVAMTTDTRITDPLQVWTADWSQLPVQAFESLDRGIRNGWASTSSRNAMRDAVRSVLREALNAGILTHDQAHPRLNAVRPEKQIRDETKQSRGHVPEARTEKVFHALAQDSSLTARRDAALIALLVGAGLRRAEATSVKLEDLDAYQETLVVTGKGGHVRDVPLSPGVRRAVLSWLRHRGDAPGYLLTPLTRTTPRQPILTSRLATNTVAQVVARRYGPDVAPHDLRRTFTGDLLDSGADLSVVSKILGHTNPATTAGYDRRGQAARRRAVQRLDLPFEDAAAGADDTPGGQSKQEHGSAS